MNPTRTPHTPDFDLYVKAHWPKRVPADCTRLQGPHEEDCLATGQRKPCRSCAAYQRLSEDYDTSEFLHECGVNRRRSVGKASNKRIVWLLRHHQFGVKAVWIARAPLYRQPSRKEQLQVLRRTLHGFIPGNIRQHRSVAEFELTWNCSLERRLAE